MATRSPALAAGPVRAPLAPRRAGPALVLAVLAVVAWLVTRARMEGMGSGPGLELGGVAFFVTVWVVMMAAMMFPSVAPVVVLYDRLRAGHRARGRGAPPDATAALVAGYLAAWTAAGLGAYGLVELGRAVLPAGALAWDGAGRYVAGGVILAAAAYQLTPLKHACLVRCRGPLMFLIGHWRHGRGGALRLGALHGAWCVGCCWALMAALFAIGVMSVGWMVVVAALIAVEKLLPWPAAANRGVAVFLTALGLAVVLAPELVPGLSAPASETMEAMEPMGR